LWQRIHEPYTSDEAIEGEREMVEMVDDAVKIIER